MEMMFNNGVFPGPQSTFARGSVQRCSQWSTVDLGTTKPANAAHLSPPSMKPLGPYSMPPPGNMNSFGVDDMYVQQQLGMTLMSGFSGLSQRTPTPLPTAPVPSRTQYHGLHDLTNHMSSMNLNQVRERNVLNGMSSAMQEYLKRSVFPLHGGSLEDSMPRNGGYRHGSNSFNGMMRTTIGGPGSNYTGGPVADRYSRKVFVGGLPPDIDEDEICQTFSRFGQLQVDWPHKAESKSYFPPKGYAFLIFQDERSVHALMEACSFDNDKHFYQVSSPTIRSKPVQIRPWREGDADYVRDALQPLDPRKTVFVGGVPRPLKAVELAAMMDRLYGNVCYAGIDTDPELKYPKGAGRVAFSEHDSYTRAIQARFVQLQHADIDKRVEIKPYVLDDQACDECNGARCGGKCAPFFCANVACLQYYCEQCWATFHSQPGREFHKPLVKEGTDRPRSIPYRW